MWKGHEIKTWMSINKVFLEHSLIHLFTWLKWVLLCCDGRAATGTVVFKTENIDCVALCRKHLLTPGFILCLSESLWNLSVTSTGEPPDRHYRIYLNYSRQVIPNTIQMKKQRLIELQEAGQSHSRARIHCQDCLILYSRHMLRRASLYCHFTIIPRYLEVAFLS